MHVRPQGQYLSVETNKCFLPQVFNAQIILEGGKFLQIGKSLTRGKRATILNLICFFSI